MMKDSSPMLVLSLREQIVSAASMTTPRAYSLRMA